MKFSLLGPLTVEAEAGSVELGPPKQRAVLAVLLLHANEVVPVDKIIQQVWGETPPRTAEHSVQLYVSDLRKALSNGNRSPLIETRAPGYALNAPPDSIDILRFEGLVREGLSEIRSGNVPGGTPKLEKAIDIWTGTPLTDFAYEDFAQNHIRTLKEIHSDAVEALGGVQLDQGRLEEARNLARSAIEADPLREEPRRLLMLALYRSGRQADALREYGEYAELLANELGIEPSVSLRDLEERILLQDPSLTADSASVAEGNPYRGLQAFTEDDADVYFGREDLVAEVLARLRNGPGFVSIVGPSGSGKSSAARAGVIPALREEGEPVVVFQPGSRPLWELAGALDKAGFGSRASLLRRFESDAHAVMSAVSRPVVLIIDQFEELFTLAETDVAVRFSELIAAAVSDHSTPLRVVATLRADYYDRPLSVPALAGVFTESVVSVRPMTPAEIERAVVEPARAAGISVEPGLLAQLVADMGDEPGALPLLQATLFELFEGTERSMTLSDYETLGGLHGALTGGADEALKEFDSGGRDVVEQLMMRMIQKGRAINTARPVAVRDLIDLGVDAIELQAVLEAFGSRRLITFDRDASGNAVVEIAHEYLITEWPQLERWIDEHAEDFDRLYALDVAAREWIDERKSADFLLRGDRLDRYAAWRASTRLRLTITEAGFIDASLDLRKREENEQDEREAKEEALVRSARRRLWAFGGAVAALAATVTLLIVTLIPDPPPDVVVWFDGRGDGSFGDVIGDGIDLAKGDHDIVVAELHGDAPYTDQIAEFAERGTGLVLFEYGDIWDGTATPLTEIMGHYPDTHFVALDCAGPIDPVVFEREFEVEMPSNLTCIISGNAEMGYLAGVSAALATTTGRVGFIGGVRSFGVIEQFQSGYESGVAAISSEIVVDQVYLTEVDISGFSSTSMGEAAARYLASRGSDVMFHAAGGSGWGMMQWIASSSAGQGGQMWSIGVDSDQALQTDVMWWLDDEEKAAIRTTLLTSVVKKLDLGIQRAVSDFRTSGAVEDIFLTLANGGIVYTTTGGHIDVYQQEIDAAVEALVSGENTPLGPGENQDPVFLLDLLPGAELDG